LLERSASRARRRPFSFAPDFVNRIRALSLFVFVCTVSACLAEESTPAVQQTAADSQAAHVQAVVAAGGVVDSILPIAEHLRRFRAGLPETDTLRSASTSIKALVERWAKAVSRRDTVDLNAMVVDRAEFAWLYYPGSKLSKPPYEAPPELLWSQFLTNSDGGARRLLTRFGGAALVVQSVSCPSIETENSNRLHERCVVRLKAGETISGPMELFGTILERDGRFKFVGFANRL